MSLTVAFQIMHRINFIHSGLLIKLGRMAPYIFTILTIYLIAPYAYMVDETMIRDWFGVQWKPSHLEQ